MILLRTLLAAAALAFVLVLCVALRPLVPIDETRYLDVAWEMWQSGDYFHLTRNYELYTHKPPLLFWLINLVWAVGGVQEFAARLVAPTFAVASALALARLARRLWPEDEGIGTRAILILASFSVFLVYASATMFDTMIAFATILGISILWRIGNGRARRSHWVGFGAVLALGVYAKGPVIFVHLMPALLTMRLWAPEPPPLREAAKGFGIALGSGLILVALWLVPALIGGTPAYREELLWTQSAARVAGGMAHDRPVWFLIALVPLLLFPWIWAWRLWPATFRAGMGDPGGRLAAIWGLSGLLLFSLISGKQAHYLLPEFPAVALLLARGLGTVTENRRGGSLAAVLPVLIGLAALALAVGLIPATGDLADLRPGWAVALFGVLAIGLGVIGWRLNLTEGHLAMGIGLALAAHVLVVTSALHGVYDAGAMAARLRQAEPQGIALTGMTYNAEFNFPARLMTPVATPGDEAELRAWAEAHPQGTIFGPVGRAPTAASPLATERYNGIDFGFWPASAVLVAAAATPAPESPGPESATPESAMPESAMPETPAPGNAAPESPAPDGSALGDEAAGAEPQNQ